MTYIIYPCDLDPFGECPKPEYARDCAKCRGWTESEAEKACHDSLEKKKKNVLIL